MNNDAALLISTCDKFSDLWDWHIELLKKNWIGDLWKIYMVTDRPTNKRYDRVEIIVADSDLDFPMRIKYALDFIENDYVLLTLDDYYLIGKTDSNQLNYLAEKAKNESIDYLLLYSRRPNNPEKFEAIETLVPIDLTQRYAVNLYPAIWKKSFLKHSVQEDSSPWLYEPKLTAYARNANARCFFSNSGIFQILDVVRKGKILHNAKKYFKKSGIDIGLRPTISYLTEFKLAFMEAISRHAPKRLFKIIKKAAKLCGMKFYSDA